MLVDIFVSVMRVLPILVLLALAISEAFKILTVLPTPFKSHWIIGASVARELARAKHEVTVISPFYLHEKNVKNLVLKNVTGGEFWDLNFTF